ncbi:alpha-galactosidase [Sphingobacterium olei]|uniref:Alpha-galactosidase n=1 Tax=Sphingobacterium olei TaxID=2571155 RepID=A0A4U0NYU4_9SPHI|nr:alpha-galactosidase [Sphingobacterium olei]TJZ59973.1 alpha-galactosidase [Sphingobacterium olei]
MMKKYVWSAFLICIIGFNTVYAVDIPFGKDGKIIYDMKAGTFDILSNGKVWLKTGFSTAKNGDAVLNAKQYIQRKYTTASFKDGYGVGKKHIVTSRQKGLPDFKQVFYTYSGKDYVVLEVEIYDKTKKLVSNGFVPLEGTLVVDGADQLRSLFSPFDNDTFISYDSKSLKETDEVYSAEVGVLYNEQSRFGYIVASIEQGIWKTGVHTLKNQDQSVAVQAIVGFTAKDITRDDMPHGSLEGHSIQSAKVMIGRFSDWRGGMDTYATHAKARQKRVVHEWKEPTPVAWNSWGAMQQDISYDRLVKVTDFFANDIQPLESGQSIYIDLDSYWDKLLKGGLEGDYSELRKFADYVKSKGLKPGAYWAPFVDWGFGGGANRRVEGTNYTYGDIWTKVQNGYHDLDGTRALDPTHPGTQQRLALVIGKLKECGFEMIKIDFLGHAAIEATQFADPAIKTGMQAYHLGMEYLVKQLDGQMLIYAAISPNIATAPYVHMRRIACDAFSSIKDTRYTLNSLTYGWWQTHLYDYMDGDHVVFKGATDTENTARIFSSVITGSVVLGDDFSQAGTWHNKTQKLFANQDIWPVIADGKSFVPVETDQYAARIFIKHDVGHTYIALFNYDEQAQSVVLSNEKLGLEKDAMYKLINLEDESIVYFSPDKPVRLDAKQAKLFKAQKI